jgi:predicted DCC family thiol-disulfide oxidoreductase YuxK
MAFGESEGIMQQPVILFDGVCNFCNTTVNFIIDKDKKKRFKFTALQSEAGQKILKTFNLNVTDFDTIILTAGHRYYEKSTAALKIAKGLGGIWKLFYVFIIVPAFIRDFFYDIIAKHRYRWFGKKDKCRIPTNEEREKFLN